MRGRALGAAAALGALLFAATQPWAQNAADAEAAQKRLEALERDIARITRDQRRREGERSELEKALRESETALGKLHRDLADTRRSVRDTRAEIAASQNEQKALQASAEAQFNAVAKELRAAYQNRATDTLKLVLSEDDPQRIARLLAYHRYVLGARTETIDAYRATIADLSAIEERLAASTQDLSRRIDQLELQEERLETRQAERREVLARLEKEISSDARALSAFEADRAELEQVVREIEEAMAQLVPLADVQRFADARGAMPWPVDGRITNRFGRPRNQGRMRWQGVRLKADSGSQVSAIHHGRVVYSDWLRGSGLLLVIDHGDGYMSLYAHNESLLREVGDWVSAGAAIATVGNSGGQSEPGVYFEIRKDGKPTDPARWCRS